MMGYETKIYLVETNPHNTPRNLASRGGDKGYSFLYEKEDGWVGYEKDGNTEIHGLLPEVKLRYSSLIAMIDLCKVGACNLSELTKIDSEHFVFEDDGNTPMVVDRYDDRVKQANLDDVIAALEKDIESGGENPYRRFVTALATLKSLQNGYDDVKVLFYGH